MTEIADEFRRSILRKEFYMDVLNCDPMSFDKKCELEFALPHSSSFLLFLLIFELNDKIPEHKNNTHIIIFS